MYNGIFIDIIIYVTDVKTDVTSWVKKRLIRLSYYLECFRLEY
jgi:hypothetical protein